MVDLPRACRRNGAEARQGLAARRVITDVGTRRWRSAVPASRYRRCETRGIRNALRWSRWRRAGRGRGVVGLCGWRLAGSWRTSRGGRGRRGGQRWRAPWPPMEAFRPGRPRTTLPDAQARCRAMRSRCRVARNLHRRTLLGTCWETGQREEDQTMDTRRGSFAFPPPRHWQPHWTRLDGVAARYWERRRYGYE